ncbi:MAG: hypothetical protein JRE63_05720 [Deltaproteobacteria bacterium]|nr:hypothetical protein [Deltaproteobacteria bacterium]
MSKNAFCLAVAVLFLSPILLGTSPAALLIYCILCLTLGISAVKTEREIVGNPFLGCLNTSALLVVVFLILQVVPLPPNALQYIASNTWESYSQSVWKVNPGSWMPVSINAESTILSLLFVLALWSVSLTIAVLVDSKLQLIKLMQLFAAAVIFWSIALIVTIPFDGLVSWSTRELRGFVAEFRNSLGLWVIVFVPLLVAFFMTFRRRRTGKWQEGSNKPLFNRQEHALYTLSIIAFCLSGIGLASLSFPAKWLVFLCGCFLFASFKQFYKKKRSTSRKTLIHGAAIISVITLSAWYLYVAIYQSNVLATSSNKMSELGNNFWVGYGLGAHLDSAILNGVSGSGGEVVALGSWLHEIWLGFGFIGLIIVIFALRRFYLGIGGKTYLLNLDRTAFYIHSGALSGCVLIIILGFFIKPWQWYSFGAIFAYFMLIMVWSRRLSSLMIEPKTHSISKPIQKVLENSIRAFIAICVLGLILKLGGKFLGEQSGLLAFDDNFVTQESDNEFWLETLGILANFDSDLAVGLSQRYFLQREDQISRDFVLSSLKLRPLSSEVHIALACLKANEGEIQMATELLSSEIARNYQPSSVTERLIARLLELPQSEIAVKLINLSLAQSPELASRYIPLLIVYGFDPLELKDKLLDHPEVRVALADLLIAKNHVKEAEEIYWDTVFSKDTQGMLEDENIYLRVADYYLKTNQPAEATMVLNEGVKAYPKSNEIRRNIIRIKESY